MQLLPHAIFHGRVTPSSVLIHLHLFWELRQGTLTAVLLHFHSHNSFLFTVNLTHGEGRASHRAGR